MRFGLVSIERLEILRSNVDPLFALFDIVAVKESVLKQVWVRDIVKNGITQHF